MSEQDSFINEVSDEVRRDKLYATFKRYGWIGALAIVLLVGGASIREWQAASARAEAQEAGDAIREALATTDPAEQAAALSALGAEDNPGRAAVVRLLGAAAEVEAGNADAAAALLDTVAADTSVPSLYRDLATLKSTILSAGEMDAATRINRLDPLATPGAPFRVLALEQIAVAQVDAGDTDAALDTLRSLLEDGTATQDLRRRAQQLIVALGGSLSAT